MKDTLLQKIENQSDLDWYLIKECNTTILKYNYNESVEVFTIEGKLQTTLYFKKDVKNKSYGLTIDDLIDISLERLSLLDNTIHSKYNKKTKKYLLHAKYEQYKRTKNRKNRNVEGTYKK